MNKSLLIILAIIVLIFVGVIIRTELLTKQFLYNYEKPATVEKGIYPPDWEFSNQDSKQ